MVQWHGRSKRMPTGGKYHKVSKKRKREIGRPAAETRVGTIRKKKIRTRGANRKYRLHQTLNINVTDKKTGKTVQTTITDVSDNPANRNFARRKIITKGAIIETPLGKARVTSRPGQHGVLNGIKI